VKSKLGLLHEIYIGLLRLYPKAFWEAYGDELQEVFTLSMDDAIKAGKLETARVVLRELSHLPKAALIEHLRERRKAKMTLELPSRFDFAPGSRKEILAAIAPFLLCGTIPFLVSRLITRPNILDQMLGICMLVSMISVLLVGFFRQVPRWFMPYLGLPLPLLSALISIYWLDVWSSSFLANLSTTLLLWTFVSYGFIWGIFIPLPALLVVFSAAIPRYRPFYRRLRNDWTLLCFILYGATPSMAFFSFEGFHQTGPFREFIYLIVAAGGWLYLRNDVPWKKFLILIGGQTLSMFTAAVAQVVLYESSAYYNPRIDIRIVWWDYVHVSVAIWLWLILIMSLPLVINVLPRSENPLQTT
jgi:hypothetical protein